MVQNPRGQPNPAVNIVTQPGKKFGIRTDFLAVGVDPRERIDTVIQQTRQFAALFATGAIGKLFW